jgi:hypothetical protein
MNIDIVIFSKNRPLQLDLCIRTVKEKIKVPHTINVQFICDTLYAKGYDRLRLMHPEIAFSNEAGNFKKDYLRILSNLPNKYLLNLVDDNVVINEITDESLSRMVDVFEKNNKIHSLSLRMNPTINYCFPAKKEMAIPNFIEKNEEYILWDWTLSVPHYCWGYPHNVDSNLYDRVKFLEMIITTPFSNVNSLEANILNRRDPSKPYMLSYAETKVWNIQNNFVQGSRASESHNDCDPEVLNKMFLSGKIISTNGLYGRKVTAAHGVTPYEYIDRNPPAVPPPATPALPSFSGSRLGRIVNSTIVTTNRSAVGLFYNNVSTKMSGCYKVCQNLVRGLKELNIETHTNRLTPVLNGCLQNCAISQFAGLPPKTLIGPEIMVLPTERPRLFQQFKHWTQPSEWCVNHFKRYKETENNEMHVWPVGVDTEKFNDLNRGNFEYDCFVYFKDVTKQVTTKDLELVISQLNTRGLKHKVFVYGKYKEEEFIQGIKKSKFGIFLTGTESQGIAYLEVLSMGCPIYMIDTQEFLYESCRYTDPLISAAPYFDESCGVKTLSKSLGVEFDTFINNLAKYQPRNYVVNNHTLKLGAQKYYDILLKINGLGVTK